MQYCYNIVAFKIVVANSPVTYHYLNPRVLVNLRLLQFEVYPKVADC